MQRMRDPLAEIEQLRRHRSRAERDLSIRSIIESTAAALRRTERGLGELIELWHELLPPEVANHSELVGLRSGILEVAVHSASVRYQLDQALRGGALDELKRRYRGTLVRVRVKLR